MYLIKQQLSYQMNSMYLFIYSFQNDLAILGEIFPVKPIKIHLVMSKFYTVANNLAILGDIFPVKPENSPGPDSTLLLKP